MINEVWKDIEGYERLYQVSNFGRVKSFDRIDGAGHLRKGRIRKCIPDKNGYLRVYLCKEGKGKKLLVHRLVAQAFITNPDNLPQINHKDEDKMNNVVFLKDDGSVDVCRSNLEWCTAKYNSNYGTRTERATKNMVQTNIRNGRYDPERCGLDKKEQGCMYYQKKRDQILEYQRKRYEKNQDQIKERRRERYQRLKKKKDNKPSDESLW